MKLDGYRCDNCNIESYKKQGEWLQLTIARVVHGRVSHASRKNEFPSMEPAWEAMFATPLHFCTPACLMAYYDKEKEDK